MKGIILKDYYESFCIKKNLFEMIVSYGFLFFISFIIDSQYYFLLIIAVLLPATSCSVLQYSMEQDEIAKFDSIALTLPVTRKELILCKYISGLLYTALTAVLSFLLVLIYVFIHESFTFHAAMEIWYLGIIASVFWLSLNYMGFFWFGNKKAMIIYFMMIFVICIAYITLSFNIDVTVILGLNKNLLLAIGTLISGALLIVSYFASLKIYNLKHS